MIVGTTTDKHYEYKKEIERTVIAYGLKDKVSFHAAITDVPALYSLCDIVVCPTITAEAFGRTITEAQAMEKLIVATRIGAPVEIIEDGKTGFLVSPQDPSEMTQLLKKLFKLDAKTKDKIIKAAKLKVQKEFSLHKMCSETLNIYKEVLNT